MNMKLKAFFENIVSFFRNIEVSDIVAKVNRSVKRARIFAIRTFSNARKYANVVLRFFFAEETIGDIKKVGTFLKKISKTVARIVAIPCFFIGLFMVFNGLTSSLITTILGLFIMALPKAVLESGKKKQFVYVKSVETEKFDSSETPAFATIGDIDDSEK